MATSNRIWPVHPGEILGEELQELGMSANALAKELGVPTNRITAILRGRRGVTADTALRLSCYFGTTPQLWLNLQQTFELRVAGNRVWKGHRGTGATSGGCAGGRRSGWLKANADHSLAGAPSP